MNCLCKRLVYLIFRLLGAITRQDSLLYSINAPISDLKNVIMEVEFTNPSTVSRLETPLLKSTAIPAYTCLALDYMISSATIELEVVMHKSTGEELRKQIPKACANGETEWQTVCLNVSTNVDRITIETTMLSYDPRGGWAIVDNIFLTTNDTTDTCIPHGIP